MILGRPLSCVWWRAKRDDDDDDDDARACPFSLSLSLSLSLICRAQGHRLDVLLRGTPAPTGEREGAIPSAELVSVHPQYRLRILRWVFARAVETGVWALEGGLRWRAFLESLRRPSRVRWNSRS